MKKKASGKDIKRVVREWMERMRKAYETRHSVGGDEDIRCPQCGGYGDISFYSDRGWENRSRDCTFQFPAHLMPPTPQQFEDYLEHKKREKRIEMFLKSK